MDTTDRDTLVAISLAEAKRRVTPGTTWQVTNHVVTDPRSPSYGTRRAIVMKATARGFYLTIPGRDDCSYVEWPKAADVAARTDGAIILYEDDARFLTLAPA